jgi:hypothetical protein
LILQNLISTIILIILHYLHLADALILIIQLCISATGIVAILHRWQHTSQLSSQPYKAGQKFETNNGLIVSQLSLKIKSHSLSKVHKMEGK